MPSKTLGEVSFIKTSSTSRVSALRILVKELFPLALQAHEAVSAPEEVLIEFAESEDGRRFILSVYVEDGKFTAEEFERIFTEVEKEYLRLKKEAAKKLLSELKG